MNVNMYDRTQNSREVRISLEIITIVENFYGGVSKLLAL